jgi:hypothetical protein
MDEIVVIERFFAAPAAGFARPLADPEGDAFYRRIGIRSRDVPTPARCQLDARHRGFAWCWSTTLDQGKLGGRSGSRCATSCR